MVLIQAATRNVGSYKLQNVVLEGNPCGEIKAAGSPATATTSPKRM